MPRQNKPLLRRLLQSIPMPLLAVLFGLAVGLLAWGVLDRLQSDALRRVFERELQSQLDQRAREALIRFDHFVSGYSAMSRLLANHRRFAGYLDLVLWPAEDAVTPTVYSGQAPPWLPQPVSWGALVRPSHILLVDPQGRVREEYRLDGRPLPRALSRDPALHLAQGRQRTYLTEFDGQPYLLVVQVAEDNSFFIMGSLVLLVPVDERFLSASQEGLSARDAVVSIIDADAQRVLASSDPRILPRATAVSRADRDYLVTAQSFREYGATDLNLMFATLVSRARAEANIQDVLDLERRQRLLVALVMVGVFSLLFMLVSARLNRVLKRIVEFSRRALGAGYEEQPLRGNQLLLLEDWIRQFTRMVLAAREEMRLRHESEMRQSEALRAAIMTSSLDAIITIDGSGRIVDFNPTAEREFGHAVSDAIGRDISQLIIDAESQTRFSELLKSCLAYDLSDERESRSEMIATRANGSRFPVEVSIKPLLLEDRWLFTVYLRNITLRKHQEEEIRSLAAFPSESPIPVLRVNARGVVLYANAPSEPLLDYWGCRRLQTLPAFWRQQVMHVLETGWENELEVEHNDRVYSLLLAPISGLDYVNIYARDVTATRDAEKASRRHQTELVHVCRLSTMGEMATGMAHELNQPLAAIVNYASGCTRRIRLGVGGSGDLLEALDQITSQAKRASEIIRRLRSMVGRQQPTRDEVDVNVLVREVLRFIEHETREQRVTVELNLAAQPLPVRADLVQIEQVILNLIRNAIEALSESPAEARRILIATGYAGARTVFIRVKDNGPGIKPAAMEKLFNAFFTTKAEGIGMGLAISQTIVADHNGRIYAQSWPGKGSTFTVELPRREALKKSVAL